MVHGEGDHVAAPDSARFRVGVVGLGAMGGPIARHLLAAGREVHVVDPDAEAVRRCAELGAIEAPDGAALASLTDVVLVVVPDDDAVLAVCRGPGGVLGGTSGGSAVLLCSSVRPDTCRAVAAAAPVGVRVLDAGMTGGVRGVESGQVNLLVGGAAEDLAAVAPALSPWCSSVHHLGPLGSGQVAKTANNLIHWAQICAIVEALSLVEAYGLSASAVRAALQDGPTDSRTLRELEQMRLTWHAKDLANAQAMATTVGMSLPLAGAVRARMREITVEGVATLLGAAADE